MLIPNTYTAANAITNTCSYYQVHSLSLETISRSNVWLDLVLYNVQFGQHLGLISVQDTSDLVLVSRVLCASLISNSSSSNSSNRAVEAVVAAVAVAVVVAVVF